MVTVGALEAIRTGTTTIVENAGGIEPFGGGACARPACAACSRSRSATARTFQARCRRRGSREARRPGSRPGCATRACSVSTTSSRPGMAKNGGRIQRIPAAALAETSSPELLQAVRAFAEKHDLGYTIHLSQSRAEVDFMLRHHRLESAGVSRQGRLPRAAAVRGTLPLRGRWRYRAAREDAARSFRIRRRMAANRGVIPPIAKLRAAGAPIANGTDNNTNDLFEVMRIALLTGTYFARNDPFPGTTASAGRHARRRDPRRRASRASGTARSARSRSARRPTSSSSTHFAPTSCPPAASCRRGFTTASRPTSSR